MDEVRISLPRPCGVNWESLTPEGKARRCTFCSTTVVDTEQYTAPELEAILRSPGEHCVRIAINQKGAVKLASGANGQARKFVASVGAGMALLVGSASSFAASDQRVPEGNISGMIVGSNASTRAVAVSGDGKTYEVNVKSNGKFKIKHLPPGHYRVSYKGECVAADEQFSVVVQPGKTTRVPAVNDCIEIIVGLVEITDNAG